LGMSLLSLKKSVSFSEDGKHDVNLILVLAAVDRETHLKAISQLSRLLSGDEGINTILEADSAGQVLEVINQYSTNEEGVNP
jgi:mannitol/fructose-specific phosphotransferase system IIA component (Ntr-type)